MHPEQKHILNLRTRTQLPRTETQLPQTDAQMSLTATQLSQLTWTER